MHAYTQVQDVLTVDELALEQEALLGMQGGSRSLREVMPRYKVGSAALHGSHHRLTTECLTTECLTTECITASQQNMLAALPVWHMAHKSMLAALAGLRMAHSRMLAALAGLRQDSHLRQIFEVFWLSCVWLTKARSLP